MPSLRADVGAFKDVQQLAYLVSVAQRRDRAWLWVLSLAFIALAVFK